MLKGRKVTEPVVQQRTGTAIQYSNVAGLSKVRERSTSSIHLQATSEISNTHCNHNDHIPREYTSQAVVDIYGKAGLQATNSDRKVLVERQKQGSSSPLEPHNSRHSKQKKQTHSKPVQNRKHVEFSNRVSEHVSNVDNGYPWQTSGSLIEEQSTLTTSRDILETEINFLNNNLTQADNGVEGEGLGCPLTHVSVTVPGSTRTRPGTSRPLHEPLLQLMSQSADMADMSPSDTESSTHTRKFKGIKTIDPDGLAKIKETIRKQQSKSSSPTNKENSGEIHGGIETGIHTLHHANDPIMPREVMNGAEKMPKQRKIAAGPSTPSYKGQKNLDFYSSFKKVTHPTFYEGKQSSLSSVTLPSRDPSGFSETEVKYRIVETRSGKSHDHHVKDKKRQVSIKLQDRQHETLGTWLSVEEGDGKMKKVTRVIAPSRKSTKVQQQPKHKEMITTSSWRAGQELILRELGPLKKRSGKCKDTGSVRGESPISAGPEEYVGVTASEIQHHQALSEEARRVYTDLQLNSQNADTQHSPSREHKWKAPIKRKAPKATDVEKQQQPSAKQRHYDAEQVRRYMQRQKAERIKRQKEEELRHKEEEETRRRQLEELRSKQKQASAQSAALGKKKRQPLESLQMPASMDNNYHQVIPDNTRLLYEGGEEDMSDSSSTITGDGSDNDTPTQPRTRYQQKGSEKGSNVIGPHDSERGSNMIGPHDSDRLPHGRTRTQHDTTPGSNIRTYNDFSYDIGSVTSKFSRALQEKLNEEPGRFVDRHDDAERRSRTDRIQAIKDTAATLQNRLKEEARKIQAQSASDSGVGAGHSESGRPRDREPRDRQEEFISRYEQVTSTNTDFTVFKSNLPGSKMTMREAMSSDHTVAKTGSKLGAAGSKPGDKEVVDIGEETTVTETSTFSEITLTDESDNEDVLHTKVGEGLRHTDVHAPVRATQLHIPPPSQPLQVRTSNSWEDNTLDEFNVFSVYSRKTHDRMTRPGWEPMSKKKTAEPELHQKSSLKSAPAASCEAQRAPAGRHTRSPGHVDRQAKYKLEAPRTHSPATTGRLTSVPQSRIPPYSDDEDTEPSYTQTFLTEDSSTSRVKTTSEKQSSYKSVSQTATAAHSAVLNKQSVHKQALVTSEPAPEEQSSVSEDLSPDEVTPRGERSDSQSAALARLSPNSLEHKFYTAFNNLETMEMSLKQLTSVDRTRAVSMAQQETVSLAQMLKARQQGYEVQMKEIQIKAKLEATEATKQLEDARKRASDAAINAADMIAKVRGEGVTVIQESTRKLIDSQTQAAKATAEAAKFLTEARSLQDTRKAAKPKTTTKRRSNEAGENDDTESIASLEDYSIDVSLTEDEREEKSYRLILPSESHRKKGKHHHSDNESVTSEASSTRVLEHELQSLFAGEEGFDKFTEDIVKQFMKEEEVRAQHQASLLRLRESALLEKTKAELQWLEQQKQRMRNKGADDTYPQIRKRQRGLKMKLQEQQEEIRRLKEENKAAAKERQRQLYQEITKRAQKQDAAGTASSRKGRLGRPSEVHTEAEVSSIDEGSDVEKHRKNYKSDSEIYTEPASRSKKQDSKTVEKYKKIHLDEKFLTQRQSRLMDRRKNAEELLKWKKMLDAEEDRVFKLERKALKVWETADNKKEPSQATARDDTDKPSSKKDNGTTKDSTVKTVSMSKDRDSTQISDQISTARDESLYSSIREDIKTASSEDPHSRRMNDKNNLKKHIHSGSESSVVEDINSQSSVDDSKKLNDSSDDTMTPTYQDTFETATATSSKQHKKTAKSPLDDLKRMYSLSRSPRSPFSPRSHAKTSESESEDSVSIESQSELSDFEGRIRDLNEKLRHRKVEAEKLKKERKKKKRDSMKNKEESLKKQIEAYDNQIQSLKTDLKKEITQEPHTTVRPQIKQPRVSPPKNHQKIDTATDKKGISVDSNATHSSTKQEKDDKPGVKPSVSATKTGLDRISEGSESVTSKSDRSELMSRSDPSAVMSKTDRSEPTTNTEPISKTERSEPTYKEKVASMKELISDTMSGGEDDQTEEIEDIATEASDDKSKEMIEIDLKSRAEDMYDVSVSHAHDVSVSHAQDVSYDDDFMSEAQTHTRYDKSAKSHISEDFDSKTVPPHSARSVSEQITEQISENIPSMAGDDSFIHSLNLKIPKQIEDFNNDKSQQDNESDNENSRISNVESSRPSSGKSERSIISTEQDSSESEKSTKLPSSKMPGNELAKHTLDIDDLLGPLEEDLIPQVSPHSTPTETPRHESDTSRASNFYEPLADFEIGDRVSVTGPSGDQVIGCLLFRGNVQFAPGVWAGVELEHPDGRHNGLEDGVRYFTCRDKHGLIVPGHDLHAATEEGLGDQDDVNVTDSTDDGDLLKIINEAARNVEEFVDSPQPSPRDTEQLPAKLNRERIDKITNDLFESVIKGDLTAISSIAEKQARRKGPPVAPKPKSSIEPLAEVADRHSEDEDVTSNDQLPDCEQELLDENFVNDRGVNETTDSTVANMMNDAIEHMLNIRQQSRGSKRHEMEETRDSGVMEEDQLDSPASPTAEIEDVIGKPGDDDDDDLMEAPLRPGSPIPGQQQRTESHLKDVDNGLEYDDELWPTPGHPPPAYPIESGSGREYRKPVEDVFYAVPHDEQEVNNVVSSAVDAFWEQRRYGESLTNLQPTEEFYTHEEIGSDLISNSRRVFKTLLFDLTGEVIRSIYHEEEYDSPVAWHKPKRKTNKFYRGASPPRTVDVLKPVVQQAVVDILGLNGGRKGGERSRWGVRKKKDLVDSILVQELREEEPEWINYDDDELAVKMQLTDTIFHDLLTDTVQTMNKIFRKKHNRYQQAAK